MAGIRVQNGLTRGKAIPGAEIDVIQFVFTDRSVGKDCSLVGGIPAVAGYVTQDFQEISFDKARKAADGSCFNVSYDMDSGSLGKRCSASCDV